MRLLLLSNSTNAGESFLAYSLEKIHEFLGQESLKALFIPYAAVTFSYDEYEKKVAEKFHEAGHEIISIHHFTDPVAAVRESQVIVTGGGNTWKLLKTLRDNDLLSVIKEKVISGTPYIGWSAGSNVACPTIRTTNDMPVVEPDSFVSLGLVPFQINPHYTDSNLQGHAGETREQRILEFIEMNPGIYVTGLREGSMFTIENDKISFTGNATVRIFKKGTEPVELGKNDDLSFLLK